MLNTIIIDLTGDVKKSQLLEQATQGTCASATTSSSALKALFRGMLRSSAKIGVT